MFEEGGGCEVSVYGGGLFDESEEEMKWRDEVMLLIIWNGERKLCYYGVSFVWWKFRGDVVCW